MITFQKESISIAKITALPRYASTHSWSKQKNLHTFVLSDITKSSKMASPLALQNFPGFCKEAIPQDWFPRGEEVTFCKQFKTILSQYYQVSTGTTLVAVEFNGGVVIGADSRTSMVRLSWMTLLKVLDDLVKRLG